MSEARKIRRKKELADRKKLKKNISKTTDSHVGNREKRKLISASVTIAFLLGSFLTFLVIKSNTPKTVTPFTDSHSKATTKQTIADRPFSYILDLTPEQVEKFDITELNLLCGSGLEGNKKTNIEECMKTFDRLVEMVRKETKRNQNRWKKDPSEYQNSEAYFKMGMLITVVRQDYGARYNPELISDPKKVIDDNEFYGNASNVFLQGLLSGEKKGTCANMPVLYVAIARKLNYPVYLVSTKGHLFCRWQSETERINFEGTGEGIRTDPDETYHKFPYPLNKWEKTKSTYLKNLSRAQELAIFLDARASCLVARDKNAEALISAAQAIRLTQKDGLTGLTESITYGRMIPNQVFTLAFKNKARKQEDRDWQKEIRELNRRNQANLERHLPHNQTKHNPLNPTRPQFNLPNNQHNPYSPNRGQNSIPNSNMSPQIAR